MHNVYMYQVLIQSHWLRHHRKTLCHTFASCMSKVTREDPSFLGGKNNHVLAKLPLYDMYNVWLANYYLHILARQLCTLFLTYVQLPVTSKSWTIKPPPPHHSPSWLPNRSLKGLCHRFHLGGFRQRKSQQIIALLWLTPSKLHPTRNRGLIRP